MRRQSIAPGALALTLTVAAAALTAGCPTAQTRRSPQRPNTYDASANYDDDDFKTEPSGQGNTYGVSGEMD